MFKYQIIIINLGDELKKISILVILIIFMLFAISFANAVGTKTTIKKKESPLYKIRSIKALSEILGESKEIIIARIFGYRLFLFDNFNFNQMANQGMPTGSLFSCYCYTVEPNTWKCTFCQNNCYK